MADNWRLGDAMETADLHRPGASAESEPSASTLAARSPSPPRLSAGRLVLLSCFWMAVNAHWGALLLVLLPSQALVRVGEDHKGTALALVLGVGAVVALLLPPIVGAASDRSRHRWGRRRPFMVAGVLVNLLGLALLAWAPSLAALVLAYLVIQIGNNLATAPYAALIPDLVPAGQRGAASGAMGVAYVVGTLIGAGVAGSLVDASGAPDAYARQVGLSLGLVGLLLAVALAVTATAMREPRPPTGARPGLGLRALLGALWLDPRAHPEFARVFSMRLLVMMGMYTVQQFLQYFLRDVVGAPFRLLGWTAATTAEGAVTFLAAAILLGAGASTAVAGPLSDRVGRRGLARIAIAAMTAVALALPLVGSFGAALAAGLAFGAGYGAYLAVEWALACDTLPSGDDAAKDMGIWHVAIVLPQMVAVPVAGPLLDAINRRRPDLGYPVIFLLAALYFAAGSLVVRGVRERAAATGEPA